jgi:excisionase family DNA binding protein
MSTESSESSTGSDPLSAKDAALLLGVSPWTARRLFHRREIAAWRSGIQWRTTALAVEAYRAANSNQLTAA